ncbi:hypothetical protein NHJ13051_002721 [Beauveria bassiana]
MAQTGSRKRGRATADSVDSDQLNNSKRANATRRRSTRSAKDREAGKRLGGKNLQGAIKAAKQSRKGAVDAIEEIRAKGDEVFLEIDSERRRFNDGHSGRADGSFADSLATERALHSHDPIAGCEAFEEAKRALQKFHLLMARYHAVDNQTSCPAEPRWMRWKQDVVDLNALNGKAKRLARQMTEGHLAPTGWPDLAGPQTGGEDQELAQIAMEILDEAMPKGTATWGTAAVQLVDVYGRMLKDTF